MKLKYHIEFTETIEDPTMIEPEALSIITEELNEHLRRYLTLAGIWTDEIKIEFDLEEE